MWNLWPFPLDARCPAISGRIRHGWAHVPFAPPAVWCSITLSLPTFQGPARCCRRWLDTSLRPQAMPVFADEEDCAPACRGRIPRRELAPRRTKLGAATSSIPRSRVPASEALQFLRC